MKPKIPYWGSMDIFKDNLLEERDFVYRVDDVKFKILHTLWPKHNIYDTVYCFTRIIQYSSRLSSYLLAQAGAGADLVNKAKTLDKHASTSRKRK